MKPRLLVLSIPLVAALAVTYTLPGSAAEDESLDAVKAAVDALGKAYAQAYTAGDADALVACLTPNAEYVNESGKVTTGRRAIRELAARFFKAWPGVSVRAEGGALRLLSDGAAVRDGLSTVTTKDGRVLSRSRYTVLFARHEGKWLIARLREFVPGEGTLTHRERLEPLSWLVGKWMDESDGALIRSECRWSDDGPYLIQTFDVDDRKGGTKRFTQRIGWDPLLGKIRSWIFGSDGGYGAAIWTPVENGWSLESQGVSVNGTMGTATHRLTPKGPDAYRWETLRETVGGASVADRVHHIVRQPPEPK